ncbi:type II toxin-antitoxin system PemK/MazF family toxin [Streptomyces sp. PSKA54]|uniref:Type II toxin-antitoxin system PemK/MazF family toxin n=1 Tax=Streptomyces himalayensis subsp. aureolus TaxID=2758039 RepID=A0A7W2CWY2_9ACTN|nr:type II toxin-antitoxin system PemK/MazF family toxin [Streptomyces himalayensis]MBA4860410.1 type II toxin-antitoxin system PemK/MazF family toxin [Streptomyces himalayensis subsp. aureolus]
MDTSWWLALAAVVLLALVAALVDSWGPYRVRRRRGRTRPPGRPGERPEQPRRRVAPRPKPAEIWWANVPYERAGGASVRPGGATRGTGRGKDRPCLVLSVHGDTALVAKITSKYRDERPGVIPLPPGSVGDAQGRPSFLETDELRNVAVWEFRRRAGVADPVLWDQVRHLAR